MDRSIEHEQNVSRFPFGVLVLRAPSNRLVHLRPLVPAILDALTALPPGSYDTSESNRGAAGDGQKQAAPEPLSR